MRGWIKLHRRIQDHWLWHEKPFDRRSAWIDLLLMASHTDRKVVFADEIVYVRRGEIITSEVKLSERWGWSRKKVHYFLALLEKDGIIEIIRRNSKGTALRIVNYSVYQNSGTVEEQHRNSQGTAILSDLGQNSDELWQEIGQHMNSGKANEDMAFVDSWDRKRTVKEQQKNSSGTSEEQPKALIGNTYKNKEYKNVKKEKKGDIYILLSNSPADAGEESAPGQKETVSLPQEHMPSLAEKEQMKQEPQHTPPSPKSRDETPYTEIVAAWNEMARANGLPVVQKITDQRKRAIRAHWREEGGERDPDEAMRSIRTVFERVGASDFLTGRKEGATWRADFDWVLKPDHLVRIQEGRYDNRPTTISRNRKDMPRAFESLFELLEDAKSGRVGGSIFDD